jgi:hypothetical protein
MKVKIEKLNSRPKDTLYYFQNDSLFDFYWVLRIKIIWRDFWLVYEKR